MIFLLETRERAKRTPVVKPAVLLQEVVREFVDGVGVVLVLWVVCSVL